MATQSLEIRYIKHLDDIHFKGYAEQLFFDDERAYYKGMFEFLLKGLSDDQMVEDKNTFQFIVKNQRKNLWISAAKEVSLV